MSVDKSEVEPMFDAIAYRYDFLNHLLTLGIDHYWRRVAVKRLKTAPAGSYLDVATGTGDLAIAIARHKAPKEILGVDISEGMMAFGAKKIDKRGLADTITFKQENCEALTFPDERFDAATIGFGIRNFTHPEKGLSQIYRVLRQGGELVVLEFSRPKSKFICWLFDLYFCHILPTVGKLFSKHSSAYTYLPQSVIEFAHGEAFADMMREAGFSNISYESLFFGIAMLYRGEKR